MANSMPTGAKGAAAVSFAVVGFLFANVYIPLMPEAQSIGSLPVLTAILGGIVGWQVMGNSVGTTYARSIGAGWKTVVVLIFVWLLLFGIYLMLGESVKMRYDGPGEAIIDVFKQMLDGAPPLLSPNVLSVALIGGGIAGMVSENANRRWR